MTVVLDDHLLRDWLVGPDATLRRAVGHHDLATTNLWYARLCKSAARHRAGTLLGSWGDVERDAVIASLLALPPAIRVLPMLDLAWRMGQLSALHTGLSTLGAEAVAAAESLSATILVSSRDDGPGIRACCRSVGVTYRTVRR